MSLILLIFMVLSFLSAPFSSYAFNFFILDRIFFRFFQIFDSLIYFDWKMLWLRRFFLKSYESIYIFIWHVQKNLLSVRTNLKQRSSFYFLLNNIPISAMFFKSFQKFVVFCSCPSSSVEFLFWHFHFNYFLVINIIITIQYFFI